MRLSYPRALFLLVLAALAVFALRPVPQVDAALELACSPLRLLAELTLPVDLVRARAVRAAESAAGEREERERAERAQLFADELRFALPRAESLRAGRSFARAQVVGRDPRHPDRCRIAFERSDLRSLEQSGLERGLPVVTGEVYVGRLREPIADRSGDWWIDLATSRDFFVGGAAVALDGAQRVHLVAGGVCGESARSGRPKLALHDPERADLAPCVGWPVEVAEELSPLEPFAREASGFLLGELEDTRCIAPPLDFKSGLFQVAVVGPPERFAASPKGADLLADPTRWVRARVLFARDPAPRREGLTIAAGTASGVEPGFAAVVGARFAGRVARAGLWSAHVATLGDRGVRVTAVARLAGVERPAAIGALVSLGRDQRGDVRLRWEAPVALESPEGALEVEAALFTGSGERGVPRGLFLGRARLPVRADGPIEVRLEQDLDPRDLGSVWVALTPVEVPAP